MLFTYALHRLGSDGCNMYVGLDMTKVMIIIENTTKS